MRRRRGRDTTAKDTKPAEPEAEVASSLIDDSPTSVEAPSGIPSYLQHNDWEKELNYKLWVTKGSRFVASNRCLRQNYWSKLSLNFLSTYLVILGLMPFFLKATSKMIPWELIGLATTGVSILAMIWGMHESAEQYELKAHKFHQCALAVGRLYSKLRQAKQLPGNEKNEALRQISDEYDEILAGHENHEPLDFELFKLQKVDYFKLEWLRILAIKAKALIFTRLLYVAIVVIPIIGIGWLFEAEIRATKPGSGGVSDPPSASGNLPPAR
jgi:hypothetical protein